MLKTICGLSLVLLLAAGCDDPAMQPPKAAVASAPQPPTQVSIVAVRNALGPCEAAMDAAADPIGKLAAGGRATLSGRELIDRARLLCDGATAEIQALRVWGRLKDPCSRAANARETVASGALALLDTNRAALGMQALRDKIADQAAISRACAGEITLAERNMQPG